MEHTRKMALMDPRLWRPFDLLLLLQRIRWTGSCEDVMTRWAPSLTEQIDEGDKVKLYNQILLRYNTLADKRFKQPIRVVVVKDDGTAAAAAMREAETTQPAAASKPLVSQKPEIQGRPFNEASQKRSDFTMERQRWVDTRRGDHTRK